MFGFFSIITNTKYYKLIRSMNDKKYDHIGLFYDSGMSNKRQYNYYSFIDGEKNNKYIKTNNMITHYMMKDEYKCQFTFFIVLVCDINNIFVILKLFFKQFEINIDDIFDSIQMENSDINHVGAEIEGTVLGSPPNKKRLTELFYKTEIINNDMTIDFIKDTRDCHLLFDKFLEEEDNKLETILSSQSKIRTLNEKIEKQNEIINKLSDIFRSGVYDKKELQNILKIESKSIIIDHNSIELNEFKNFIKSIVERNDDQIITINITHMLKLLNNIGIVNEIIPYSDKEVPAILRFHTSSSDEISKRVFDIDNYNDNIKNYTKNELKEILFFIESYEENKDRSWLTNKIIELL